MKRTTFIKNQISCKYIRSDEKYIYKLKGVSIWNKLKTNSMLNKS